MHDLLSEEVGVGYMCTDELFHRELDRRVRSPAIGQTVILQSVGQTGYSTDSWTDGICHR